MRGNILTNRSSDRLNKILVKYILKRTGNYTRIASVRKSDKQLKITTIPKSNTSDVAKFSRSLIFLLSLIICNSLFTSCDNNDTPIDPSNEFVYIPDNQFESILIEQGIDTDGIINQKISQIDALKVTYLDLNLSSSNLFIEDLTGIEGFTNICYLSASGHLIEEIDLSHNTHLKTLLLQANELYAIHGLSNLNSLIKLDLSWNLLDSLLFESETIEILLATNNLLEFFEVGNAVKLKDIILTSNKLSSVDLNIYPLLETLLLSDNHIENIDLELCNKLSYLYISGNLLSELNVSNNQNLVDLRVDRNPTLTCIQINDNQGIPSYSLSEYQELSTNCN